MFPKKVVAALNSQFYTNHHSFKTPQKVQNHPLFKPKIPILTLKNLRNSKKTSKTHNFLHQTPQNLPKFPSEFPKDPENPKNFQKFEKSCTPTSKFSKNPNQKLVFLRDQVDQIAKARLKPTKKKKIKCNLNIFFTGGLKRVKGIAKKKIPPYGKIPQGEEEVKHARRRAIVDAKSELDFLMRRDNPDQVDICFSMKSRFFEPIFKLNEYLNDNEELASQTLSNPKNKFSNLSETSSPHKFKEMYNTLDQEFKLNSLKYAKASKYRRKLMNLKF
ncbi:unnamed protein product [Moneuplotes crassus]|uniref:Uncharacterized protein n=1 Tax=Euplotes crassus TaxID=5936 RepID=A0AAD1XF33_EUPCR|nr:unnamed protein product [Moneuplotes crassus]